MASDEYDGRYECYFADGFAFLLREEGTSTYTNLAVLPDGITPVSITNINQASLITHDPQTTQTHYLTFHVMQTSNSLKVII